MRTIAKLAVAGILLAATASPAAAFRPPLYVYSYTYYSDASKTTVVGYSNDICWEFEGRVWVQTFQHQTLYYTAEISHECRVGGPL
ncbi:MULTISPECIES: hypothetical protein [unclassified Brevundimonas]|uniref:hypothetical protein n=1 Tax=unclassified Brevundimonas TaxID=2622653 RepID=UPI0025BA3746|nr:MULTISPECIES: hypothetical protein [unclassified Brevundimonas]